MGSGAGLGILSLLFEARLGERGRGIVQLSGGVAQRCACGALQEGGSCAQRIRDWLRRPGRVRMVLVEGGKKKEKQPGL